MVQITTGLDPHRLKAIEGVNKGHLKTITKTKKNYPHHDFSFISRQWLQDHYIQSDLWMGTRFDWLSGKACTGKYERDSRLEECCRSK